MTEIRIVSNVRERSAEAILAKLDWLGVRHPTFFVPADHVPPHVEEAASRYDSVIVQLMSRALFARCPDWREVIEQEMAPTIAAYGALGIHHYTWAIEHNLNGLSYHPATRDLVSNEALVERFSVFYETAHQADPQAVVMTGPYPNRLINLSNGLGGWKSWVRKYEKRIPSDKIALDMHVGTWLPALSRKAIAAQLRDAVNFMRAEGFDLHFVEVGYPTMGYKPPAGLYGWGRRKDQLENLKACYETLSALGVPYMQIYELVDPLEKMYEDCHTHGIDEKGRKRFGDKEPTFLGLRMKEEAHFGLFAKDGRPKLAADWIREVCRGL